MLKRRDFLKTTGMAALSGLAVSKAVASGSFWETMPPAGVQLYTFFNVIDADVPGTLQKIADIGYKNIESAFSKKGGYYGMTPKAFAALVKDKGLSWKSHHVLGAPFQLPPGRKMPNGPDGKPIVIPPMKNLRDNMQELVDEAAEGGIPYLVCASIPLNTTEEIKSAMNTLNKTDEACKKAGIQFAYHNHYTEFKPVDGVLPYDIILKETPVALELDLAWVTKAGVNPVTLFEQNPGRYKLWHVKDIDKELKQPQPVGTGVVNFKNIFEHAKTSGMQYYFVEHDNPADPFASITTSMQNLKKIWGSIA